jgi:hypothetical protein
VKLCGTVAMISMIGTDACRVYVDKFVGVVRGIRSGDSNGNSNRLRENYKLCVE